MLRKLKDLEFIDGIEDVHREDRDFVLIGNGSTVNYNNWDGSGYCVCCSNTSWIKYEGTPSYLVIAREHLYYVLSKMPKEMRDVRKVIDICEDVIHEYETTRNGSFLVFLHYLLKTKRGKKIVLQGVDFDGQCINDKMRWGRYYESMRRMLYENELLGASKNHVYTVSNKLELPFVKRLVI